MNGPKSLLGQLFLVDCSHSYTSFYDNDTGYSLVLAPRGRGVSIREERDETVKLVPFNAPKDKAAEERMVMRLLRRMADETPMTVTCTRGYLSMVGLDHALRMIDCRRRMGGNRKGSEPSDRPGRRVASLVMHPAMLEQENFRFLKEKAGGKSWIGGVVMLPVETAKGQETPTRDFSVVLSRACPKNEVYAVVAPEYLGVYALMEGGKVGMALMNQAGVARCVVTGEGL